MSGSLAAWYSFDDLGILAARQAALAGEIELRRMPRLRELLTSTAGSVKAALKILQRREGYVMIELDYRVELELECQRCLEPFGMTLEDRIRLAVALPSAEAALPADCEPVLLEDGRLRPADLVEEELIIALPLAPKHAVEGACGVLANRAPRGSAGLSLD